MTISLLKGLHILGAWLQNIGVPSNKNSDQKGVKFRGPRIELGRIGNSAKLFYVSDDGEEINVLPALGVRSLSVHASVDSLTSVELTLSTHSILIEGGTFDVLMKNPYTREIERVKYIKFDDKSYIRFGDQGLIEMDNEDGLYSPEKYG